MGLNKFELYKKEFQNNNYVLLIEENMSSMLRTISLLQIYGIQNFTYPYGWRIGESKVQEIIKHNFEHISEIKENNSENINTPFCMITSSKYDNIAEYSIMSLINKSKRKMIIVLKEDDTINRKLKGFIRPISETELIFSNTKIHYNTLYNDTIEYFVENSNFESIIHNCMNLYLQYVAFILQDLFEFNNKNSFEFLNFLLEESFNPLYFSIVKIINGIKFKDKSKIVEKIGNNLGYNFNLTNYEIKKLKDIVLENYYENKLEIEYWVGINNQRRKLVKKIQEKSNSLKDPIRSGLLYHWNSIINHIC